MSHYMSTVEAGKALGITDQSVRQLLKEGEIPGQRVGKQWIVPKDWVEANRGEFAIRHVRQQTAKANGSAFTPYGELVRIIQNLDAKVDRLIGMFESTDPSRHDEPAP